MVHGEESDAIKEKVAAHTYRKNFGDWEMDEVLIFMSIVQSL